MAFTINRRLSTLVDSNGQLNTGKIPNDYIDGNHIADNSITTAMLHTSFTVSSSNLSSIDTDAVSEGSSNLYFTTARVDSHLSGGTGVTYSSGAISIGQAVGTSDSPTFADLTLTGNLNITGDINSYNVTDLDVTDQTITLGAGQIEANSGGSGIIIDGASASILWDETNDEFDINKGLNVTGNLTVDTNTLFVDATNNRVGILDATPAVSLDIGSATDAIYVPSGTTAQRPGSPAAGYFRYNSTTSQFEGYTTEWGAIAGSGGSAMETDTFTGDGSTTAFTLSTAASSEDNLIVFIEGVYQNKDDYVVSGTTLTFDVAPVNTRKIVVHHVKDSISGNNMILNQFSGDGSTTAFTLTVSLTSENNSQIYIDGVYQQKDSYTVGGTTLTFDTAPANGTTIEVMIFTQTTINVPTANSIGISELNVSDGTNGQVLTTNGSGTLSFSTISGYTDSDVETYLNTSTIYTDPTNDRLGIGTASPSYTLTVQKDVDSFVMKVENDGNSPGTSGNSYADASDGLWVDTRWNTATNTPFKVTSNSGTTPMMIIKGDGKVGIGGNSPQERLHLDDGSSTNRIRIDGPSTSSYYVGYDGSTDGIQIASSSIIKFQQGSSFNESMRIDSTGKIGIAIPGAGYDFSNNAPAQTLQIGAYNNSGTYEVPTVGLYYSTVPLLLSNGFTGTYGTGSIGLNKTRTDNASSSFSTPVNGAYHSVGIDFITGTGDSSIEFRTETGVIAYVNNSLETLIVNNLASDLTVDHTGIISRGGMSSNAAEGGSGGTSNSYGAGVNRHISFSYSNNNQSYAHSIATRHNSANRGNNTIDFYIWDPSKSETAVASDRAISIHNGALELVPITTTQRDAFATGNYQYNGMILYNETEGKFQGRSNGQWINFKTEDDFPVTDSLFARYTADSFTYNGSSTPPTWNDVSGNGRNITSTSTSTGGGFWVRNSSTWPTKVTNSTNTNGASKSFDAVQFENTEGLALPDDSNISAFASSGFSFAYVARYLNSNGANAYRIMDGQGSNNLIGFWDNQRGVNFDGSWIVGSTTQHSSNLTEWCIIVFRSSQMTSKTKNNNSGNWVESGAITHNYVNANYSASNRRYGLNAGDYGVGDGEGEDSDFEIAEWCFWNKDLSDAEMDSVQSFLETKYGI